MSENYGNIKSAKLILEFDHSEKPVEIDLTRYKDTLEINMENDPPEKWEEKQILERRIKITGSEKYLWQP